MAKGIKMKVTARALIQRINRKLRDEDQILRAARGAHAEQLGRYFIVNLRRNSIVAESIDLAKLASELGVLKNWEQLS